MPVIVGVDIGLRHDFSAAVVVCRDPDAPREGVAIRELRVWQPGKHEVDLRDVDRHVRDLFERLNVVSVTADWWQAATLLQGWRASGMWVKDFPQGEQRAKADTLLLTMIMGGHLRHNGEPELGSAVMSATAKPSVHEDKIRIAKLSARSRIDALVATSMAVYQSKRLIL